MESVSYIELRDLARTAAICGGQEALSYFRRDDVAVEIKDDESPVTIADRNAEQAIRKLILDRYPNDGWLGEETGTAEGSSGRTWICDPIDGTKNFINGIPLWTTLVACEIDNQIVASAVSVPGIGDVYDAALGHGARRNEEAIQVRQRAGLDECLLCFESRDWFAKNGLADVFDYMRDNTYLQRGLCDAYAHMLIASGCADIMVEPSLSIWDIAAPSLIVTEAGGRFSDLSGEPSIRSNNAVCTNGAVHDVVLELIRSKGVTI